MGDNDRAGDSASLGPELPLEAIPPLREVHDFASPFREVDVCVVLSSSHRGCFLPPSESLTCGLDVICAFSD